MNDATKHREVEVELQPGEKLKLPPGLVDSVGAGRGRITVEPGEDAGAVRRRAAFLAGYAAEDEGLYDDDAGR
ncbi:MAG TPA: hypothetical protein DDY78_21635 [Planctomycetales bacterium]|jgi:hypothetical protein|nr:hypothetical protein [Planctomycetales bacterium]